MELPFISCLCPTYNRPEHLKRSIAMFLAQSYPAERCELVVCDDGDRLWKVIPEPRVDQLFVSQRFPSLPEKYSALVRATTARDACAIWEDDDEYRPDYLLHHAQALLRGAEWSKPSIVWSDYANPPRLGLESDPGRFFSSIVFRHSLFARVGGFVMTKRADFDQQFIARLRQAAPPGDPCDFGEPQFVYRWHTGAYHGQNYMRGPDDESWYERAGAAQRSH